MPKRNRETFDRRQKTLIHKVAREVFADKFRGKDKPQTKMALALGISQTSVSALLRGNYTPSVPIAEELAVLAGYESLREMVGDYFQPGTKEGDEARAVAQMVATGVTRYPNLRTCIEFHQRRWAPYVIAAAEAGFFKGEDVAPKDWEGRLDELERKFLAH